MLIFIMSSMPSPVGTDPFPHFDKLAHFLVYGVFALLVFRGISGTTGNCNFILTAVLTVLITVAYGMSDEFHQSFVPARSPDVKDLAVDGIGAVAAVAILYIRRRCISRSSA